LYDPIPEHGIDNINSVENGIMLSKTLHAMFGIGRIALLNVREVDIIYVQTFSKVSDFQTPSFALDPADIFWNEVGPVPPSRITLQHLKPPTGRLQVPAYDACMIGTGIRPPPSILLDFMYGVAAYRRWCGGDDIDEVMQKYFADQYQSIVIPPAELSDGSDDSSDHEDPMMSTMNLMGEANGNIRGRK
jgi:hypothetical protein